MNTTNIKPVVRIKKLTDWDLVLDAARKTMGLEDSGKEPSSLWKQKILMARHSPIRNLKFKISIKNLPYWVSVHLVRHKFGVEHFVSSQRDDRNEDREISRGDLPQSTLVKHDMVLNAESIMNISKKRLCMKASPETRAVWKAVVNELYVIGEAELASFCKPECWWMGDRCPEMQPCGLCETKTMPLIPRDILH